MSHSKSKRGVRVKHKYESEPQNSQVSGNQSVASSTIVKSDASTLNTEGDMNDTNSDLGRVQGTQENFHGTYFEVQVLMLCCLNALSLKLEFTIIPGFASAGIFDDVTVFYRQARAISNYKCFLLQAKHLRANSMIDRSYFEREEKRKASLLARLYKSYVETDEKILQKKFGPAHVREQGCELDKVVFCTNAKLDPTTLLNQYTFVEAQCPSMLRTCKRSSPEFYEIPEKMLKDIGNKDINVSLSKFLLAVSFGDDDCLNLVLEEKLFRLSGSGKIFVPSEQTRTWRNRFFMWLLDFLSRKKNHAKDAIIEHAEISSQLERIFQNDLKLFLDALTWSKRCREYVLYPITAEELFSEEMKMRFHNAFQNKNFYFVCVSSLSDEQPLSWTTAQLYHFLMTEKLAKDSDILLLSFDEASKNREKLVITFNAQFTVVLIECHPNSCAYNDKETFMEPSKEHGSKVIFINSPHTALESQCSQCRSLRFSDLDNFHEKLQVTFQGVEASSVFADIAKERLDELINTKVLKTLLSDNPKIRIGKELRSSTDFEIEPRGGGNPVYLDRTLRLFNKLEGRKLFQTQRTSSFLETDLFLIVDIIGESDDLLREFENIKRFSSEDFSYSFLLLETNNDQEADIRTVVNAKQSTHHIHQIRVVMEKKSLSECIWLETSSSFRNKCNIHAFVNKSSQLIDEKGFFLQKRVSIIASDPGMGKSYFAQSQLCSKEKNLLVKKHVWKIILNLCDHEQTIKGFTPIELKEVAHFLARVSTTEDQPLSAHFLSHFISGLSQEHAVLLLFDGFDEIRNDAQKKIVSLIKFLLQLSSSVWMIVTTRKHALNYLQESLCFPIYELEPFSREQQMQYLRDVWQTDTISIVHAQKRIQQMASSFDETLNAILGASLLCRIVAEVYMPLNKDSKIELPSEFTLPGLYEKFMSKKCSILLKRTIQQISGVFDLDSILHSHFRKVHERASLLFLFPDVHSKWCHFNYDDTLSENNRNIINALGIAQVRESEPFLHFAHRTFAEYFVASLCANTLSDGGDEDQLVRGCMRFLTLQMYRSSNGVTKIFFQNFVNQSRVACLLCQRWQTVQQRWLKQPCRSREYRSNRPQTAEWKNMLEKKKIIASHFNEASDHLSNESNPRSSEANYMWNPLSEKIDLLFTEEASINLESLLSCFDNMITMLGHVAETEENNAICSSFCELFKNTVARSLFLSKPDRQRLIDWYNGKRSHISKLLPRKKLLPEEELLSEEELVSEEELPPGEELPPEEELLPEEELPPEKKFLPGKKLPREKNLFSANLWLKVLYNVRDVEDAPDQFRLHEQYPWLFKCVFPTLFEYIGDRYREQDDSDTLSTTIPVFHSLADVLWLHPKKDDQKIVDAVHELRENIDLNDVKTSDEEEIGSLSKNLEKLLDERGKNQDEFIQYFFNSSAQSRQQVLSMDSLLKTCEEKMVKAVNEWFKCIGEHNPKDGNNEWYRNTRIFLSNDDFCGISLELIKNFQIFSSNIAQNLTTAYEPLKHLARARTKPEIFYIIQSLLPIVISPSPSGKINQAAFISFACNLLEWITVRRSWSLELYEVDCEPLPDLIKLIQQYFDYIFDNKEHSGDKHLEKEIADPCRLLVLYTHCMNHCLITDVEIYTLVVDAVDGDKFRNEIVCRAPDFYKNVVSELREGITWLLAQIDSIDKWPVSSRSRQKNKAQHKFEFQSTTTD